MVLKKKNLLYLLQVEFNFYLKILTLNKTMLNNFCIIEYKTRLVNILMSKFGFALNMFDLAEKTQTVKNISLFFYNINNLKIQNVINLNFTWNSVTIFFTFFVFFFVLFVLFVFFFDTLNI